MDAATGLADVDRAQPELVGVGMAFLGDDPAHPEELEVVAVVRRPDPVDAFDLGAAHAEQLGELLDRTVPGDVVAQPADGHPHQNCSRKRRSLSKNERAVGHAVLEHRHALDAHAEGEALQLAGVVADEAVEVGIDHAGAEDLEPAGVLARAAAGATAEQAFDVELDARLGEREEVRPQTDGAVGPEELAGELVQRALEVGQGDAAVDGQALDLVEHRRVRGVEVGPVDLAGTDDVDGRRLRLHGAHLDRRGLGAQQQVTDQGPGGRIGAGRVAGAAAFPAAAHAARTPPQRGALIDEEGVVERARGVVVGRVQRREVVVVELELGTLGDPVAQAQEDVLDLADGARDEVHGDRAGAARRAA